MLKVCFCLNSDTFEYEKGLNIEQVEQLQAMEKKLISMAGEVEKLKLDIFRAEKRAQGNLYLQGDTVD